MSLALPMAKKHHLPNGACATQYYFQVSNPHTPIHTPAELYNYAGTQSKHFSGSNIFGLFQEGLKRLESRIDITSLCFLRASAQ